MLLPNGFKEGYALDAHRVGTMLLKRLVVIFSKLSDITTNPFRAFNKSFKVVSMTTRSLLYRIASCMITVFRDSWYLTGYLKNIH